VTTVRFRLRGCTIVTTESDDVYAQSHNRMSVTRIIKSAAARNAALQGLERLVHQRLVVRRL
jgi:hypothetical protein